MKRDDTMTVKKGISLLGETELFRGLGDEKIKKILTICTEVHFRHNQVIMKEGAVGSAIYIIIEGTVEVAKSLIIEEPGGDDNRANKVFTKLRAEEHPVFGEIALLEESDRTATIKAITDCVFYEIKKDDFLRLAEADKELGYVIMSNLARIVSSRLRKANEDVVKLTTALSIVLKET